MRFFLPLVFFLTVESKAQLSISGLVTTQNHTPIPNATVYIQNKDSLIIGFTKTKENGFFILTNIDINEATFFGVSHIGYRKFVRLVKLLGNTKIVVELIRDSTLLNEVIVNSRIPPVKNFGDTTRYHLPSFINGSEIRLEDVLRKLPGIVVDDFGNLSFNGKRVNKVLVEGQDFFSKDYTLITKTLSAELIASVDAIENFNEEDFFSEVKKGEETVINVGIKKDVKLKLFGELAAAVGTDKNWQLANSLFSISGKKQLGVINNYNNYGEDIKPNVSEQILVKDKLKSPQNFLYSNRDIPITNFTPISTSLNSNRNVFANVGVSTVQLNTRIGKFISLKSLTTFKRDHLSKQENLTTSVGGVTSLSYIDSGLQSTKYQSVVTENNIDFLINTRNKFKIEANFAKSNFLSTNDISTRFLSATFNSSFESKNDNYPYYLKATYLKKMNTSALIELNAFSQYNQNDYSLQSFTNRYNSILGIDSSAKSVTQILRVTDRYKGLTASFYKKVRDHRLVFSNTFISSDALAESNFRYAVSSTSNLLVDPKFTNNVGLSTTMMSIAVKDDWNSKNFFSSVQLNWQRVSIENKNYYSGLVKPSSFRGIFPYFLFGYKINNRNKVGVVYSSYNQINDVLSFASGYIQQNANYFNSGNLAYGAVKIREFAITHTYNDFFNTGWKAISGFTFSKKLYPTFFASQFTNASIFRSRENGNEPQRAIGFDLTLDKYMPFLKSTVSFMTNIQVVRNYDNNVVPDFKQNENTFSLIKTSLKSGFKRFFNFYTSFQLGINNINVLQNNGNIFASSRISNLVIKNTLSFKFSDRFYGDVSNETSQFKSGNFLSRMNFCDLHFSFRPTNSKFSFLLYGRNVLNNPVQVSNTIVAPFTISGSSMLLPRMLMLSVNMKL